MKNYVQIVILCLVIINISSQILFVPEKSHATLSDCIVYILNKYVNNSIKISVMHSNKFSSAVTEIAKNTDLPITINPDEMLQTGGIDTTIPNDVILIMDESINISKILTNKWSPTTQFLVTIPKLQSSQEYIIELFHRFWDNNVVNVVSLVADENEVRIFTSVPFNQYDCDVGKPLLVATYTAGQTITDNGIIPKERVTNLNGCILNASVLQTPPNIISTNGRKGAETVNGIEGLMLIEFSRRLNFKLNFSLGRDYGWVEPKPTGAIGNVYLKKSHFACGNIAYDPQRFKYFDLSTSVGCDIECISWAVPVGSKKSQAEWTSLFVSGFGNTVWYLIVTTFISVAATFRILSKDLAIDRHRFKGNIKTILYTFRTSLGDSAPAPESSPLKILFLTWLWYCFIIITAYQALIGSKLTVPFKESNVNTFKDLLESDLQVSGLRFMFRLLGEAQKEDENIKALGNRFKPLDFSYSEVIEKIIYDRNLAFVGTTSRFKYHVMHNPMAKGRINFMKECVRKYYPVMLLQKNSPITFRVNQIITTLFESGITCHWKKQFIDDTPQIEPSVEKLSIARVKGSFVILGVGQIVALLAFVAEYGFYWYSSRDLSRRKIMKN